MDHPVIVRPDDGIIGFTGAGVFHIRGLFLFDSPDLSTFSYFLTDVPLFLVF